MGFMDDSVGDPPTDDEDDTDASPATDDAADTESSDDNPLNAPDKAEMGSDDDEGSETPADSDAADNATDGDSDDSGTPFESQLRTLITSGRIPGVSPEVVDDNIETVTDTRLLKMAFEAETRDEVRRMYATRYEDLKEGTDSLMPEVADPDADDDGVEPPVTDGGPDADAETEDDDDESPSGAPSNVGTIDISDIAPDATDVQEAAENEPRWSILAWAEPGKGKSHFAYTMPDPIVFVDTEGKADELADKFTAKDIHIFTPSDYDEAKAAVEKGLEVLDAYRTQQDRIGTIVVDSMSDMWEWAQTKYVDVYYPNQSRDEVNLSAGIGTSESSDWKQIKAYHNAKFRKQMVESPYHLCWTAMEKDDFDAVLNDGEKRAKKPAGEKTNVYKADEVFRIREDSQGRPVGELHKSGKIKHRYTGLVYPTFDKHREVVEAIKNAEKGGVSPSAVPSQTGYDVTVVEGNPKYVNRGDD